jgi:hypothetical protein
MPLSHRGTLFIIPLPVVHEWLSDAKITLISPLYNSFL